MRDVIVALAVADARGRAQFLRETGSNQREVALATMRRTRAHFMAPTEDEAFAAAVAVLWEVYPDDEALRQETAAIGERTKVLRAIMEGVPVALDEVALTPLPEPALGLLSLFEEARGDG